jgi:hypothetical protein
MVFDRQIDPKEYYPADLYRKPEPDFPEGYTIDVREIALKKVKTAQTKLSEKGAKIQAIIDAIEGEK